MVRYPSQLPALVSSFGVLVLLIPGCSCRWWETERLGRSEEKGATDSAAAWKQVDSGPQNPSGKGLERYSHLLQYHWSVDLVSASKTVSEVQIKDGVVK